MKAFVIGDIHGCLAELKELIKDIDRNKTRIISVGDMIDKGPYSRETMEFIRQEKIEVVLGNHELMLIELKISIFNLVYGNEEEQQDSMFWIEKSDWYHNGGNKVFDSYEDKTDLLADINWLETLPYYIKTGIMREDKELLVSHSLLTPKIDIETNEIEVKLWEDQVWNRKQMMNGQKNKTKYFNTYGHTPVDYVQYKKYSRIQGPDVVPEPIIDTEYGFVNLDTGCCYPDMRARGYLTGIFFPSLKVKQVKKI